MRFIIQRVNYASVETEGKVTGSIKKGMLIFMGVGEEDTRETVEYYAQKILKLRIFEDEKGKTNLPIEEIGGSLLIISQFTLYADCKKGNRPSFQQAAAPKLAEELYDYFIEYCQNRISDVQTGIFGAEMKVNLENDGPFTLYLDETIEKK